MNVKGFIVGTEFYMNEYGSTSLSNNIVVAYYGPEIKDKHVIRSLIARKLGLPSEITVEGSYGRSSVKRGSVQISSELYYYEIRKRRDIDLFIEWTGDDFVVHRGRDRFEQVLQEMKELKEKERTEKQIEIFNSLSKDEKTEYIKKIMGRDSE